MACAAPPHASSKRNGQMSGMHKIIIQNLSTLTTQFYVYQQPAVIAANGTDQSVTSTSLGTGTLLPYD